MSQLTICQGVFFLLSCCCLTLFAASLVTDSSEADALRVIKSSLVDPSGNLDNWNKGDPCTSKWNGVLCSNSSGTDSYLHVQELHMLNMNLSGNLAPELGRLSQLKVLDFMWNELTGSIPKEIGRISSLKLLLLNGNKLSGSFPDELGYLSKLDRLQVDENYISGPIPKSFANLSSVKHLHLNNNSISGKIPSELSNISALRHLLVDNNNLSGDLPQELSNLPNLRILQLDNNNFNSEIPVSYGNFSKLVKLSLRNCSLRGYIPDLSSIPNLLYLDLSWNDLTGPIPSKLSHNMTTIDLSHNRLNGSIPGSFSNFSSLQKLLVANNLLTGSVPANIWQTKSSNASAKLVIDLRNNSLTNISGDLNPPNNVTLRLGGNPVCNNANIINVGHFCGSEGGGDEPIKHSTNSSAECRVQSCPTEYEYAPNSPEPCYCAAPLRIGYRLKSPSFSYFPPYIHSFESYVTGALNLDIYQLVIDSYEGEKGPRLRMYLKLFPSWSSGHSNTFNISEVERISTIFSSWEFPPCDFFGPYELLNFTLLGPYSQMHLINSKSEISKGVWVAIILGVTAFSVAVSTIISLLIVRRRAKRQRRLSRKHISSLAAKKIEGVKRFTFREMALATDNFNSSTQVGRGGYGRVYKGTLADNTIVAIKRAEESSLQGQKEFLTEIELLSRLHHRNLVSLVGYCDEEGEQMLVYEFMTNGNLRDWLSGKGNLSFSTRLSIAIGSARGILYLHIEANPPIFHGDIKASNILLDSTLTAKVADFGLSRLAPVLDEEGNLPNHISTVVKGTPGYVDPEYFLTHKLTDKSDVYSLGVVFLELLTAMHPISRGKNIVREVNVAHDSGLMFSIIDCKMGSYPSECVERFLALALSCCHQNPDKRPSMLDVVRELENIHKMMPKADIIFSDSITYTRDSTSTSSASKLESTSLPSSFFNSRDAEGSSTLLGSDLVSGVTPTITPR